MGDSKQHWMSTSNNTNFDSAPNIDLPPRAKTQIAAIMCVKEAKILLDFVSVQEQHGFCYGDEGMTFVQNNRNYKV